jgi:hypothetical protein
VNAATTVVLSTNSSTGTFYSTSSCATTITTVSIAAGSNSASFFYDDTAVGIATITASAVGLTSASQVEMIVPKIAVSPTATASLSYASGSTFSVDINVTHAPAMNSFRVSVQYNPKVLQAVGIDLTSSSRYVLGQSVSVSFECINDDSLIGGTCTALDDVGVTTLWATLLSTNTGGITSGPLFSMMFKVLQPGFSNIHFLDARVIACPSAGCVATFVRSVNFDGYFSDIPCGGTLCTPPVVHAIYSPPIVLVGKPVFFNASQTVATNPGARINNYTWFWGSGERVNSTTHPTITKRFVIATEHTVTLTVSDSFNITGSLSLLITVLAVYINVAIGSFSIDPLAGVTRGTPVNIMVTVVNHSTRNETINLHVVLDPGGSQMKVLDDEKFLNLTALTYGKPVNIIWQTTGYVPRVYPFMASVDPVINQTDISGLTQVAYVQLVSSQPTSGLSLTVVSGIGVAVSLALLFGLGSLGRIFRKKPVDDDVA